MKESNVGDKTSKKEKIKLSERQWERVKKAKAEIEHVCEKYKVSIYINPVIVIESEIRKKRFLGFLWGERTKLIPRKNQIKNIAKAVRKMGKLLPKYNTYIKMNPVFEVRPKDSHTIKTIIPDYKKCE